jgi:hypothetical protein
MTIDNIKLSDPSPQNIGGSKTKQSRLEALPTSPSSSSQSKDTAEEDRIAAVVFSSQESQFADYTTWKGIETKTGIREKHAVSFLLKESLDNALDYIESTPQQQQPSIHVIVQRKQGKYIIIAVSNSNFDKTKAAFSKQTLESIFDFDRYHSSKRNQFKITKGALGDALKEVLCIPYVLARDYGIVTAEGEDWNYPMYIISQQRLYKIQLIIDRINQVIRSKVEESDFDSKTATAEIEIRRHSPPNPNSTQIVLTIPIIINGEVQYAELYQYVYDYAMFATHVKLIFEHKDSRFFKEFPMFK